ncbi:MAG: hypothetical protein ABSD56_00165 [Bryobacteraceae bacterium]|jgi:hypothetical protein
MPIRPDLLIFLLLTGVSPASSQSGSPEYEVAAQKERDALQALWSCRETGSACDAERAEYWKASDQVQSAINLELRAINAIIESAAADLQRITERINRYVACRRAKHWWQFWRRCRYADPS